MNTFAFQAGIEVVSANMLDRLDALGYALVEIGINNRRHELYIEFEASVDKAEELEAEKIWEIFPNGTGLRKIEK